MVYDRVLDLLFSPATRDREAGPACSFRRNLKSLPHPGVKRLLLGSVECDRGPQLGDLVGTVRQEGQDHQHHHLGRGELSALQLVQAAFTLDQRLHPDLPGPYEEPEKAVQGLGAEGLLGLSADGWWNSFHRAAEPAILDDHLD